MGGEEAAAGGAQEEVEEGGGFFAALGFVDDDADLAQGTVEVVFDKDAALVKDERVGGEADVGVTGFGELVGLANAFGLDDLVLKLGPEACFFEGLFGGAAIGGGKGVGDGDGAGFAEVGEVFEGAGLGPDRYAADGVDLAGVGIDFVLFDEGFELIFVGGEEKVEGSAIFNLAGEHAGGAESEGDFTGELFLEKGLEGGKVRGGGDEEWLLGIAT